jgi:hypothetical protein
MSWVETHDAEFTKRLHVSCDFQTGSTLWIIAAITLGHSRDVLFVVGVSYIEGSLRSGE